MACDKRIVNKITNFRLCRAARFFRVQLFRIIFCIIVLVVLLLCSSKYPISKLKDEYFKHTADQSTDLWGSRGVLPHKLAVDAQRKWIEFMAENERWHYVPKKRILSSGLSTYNVILQCRGAQEFTTDKCEFIKNTGVSNYSQFDAVLNGPIEDLKSQRSIVKQIYYLLESPYSWRADFSQNNAILVSYWRGSDIHTPYGKWYPYLSSDLERMPNQLKDFGIKNYAEGKSKLVAIFISNCASPNDRLKYVEQLQNHIQVDVYGFCGTLLCPRVNETTCFKMLAKDYKFYLAFENANCRDYITEKFFLNALQNDVVPVVMGAHRDDYKAAAPKNSYIHIEDFESPSHLANYLIIVSNNDTLYNSYFEWKVTGRLYMGMDDILCVICGMLFYADHHPPPTWKPGSTWKSRNICLPEGTWFWEKPELGPSKGVHL